jgi:hypothetical protein
MAAPAEAKETNAKKERCVVKKAAFVARESPEPVVLVPAVAPPGPASALYGFPVQTATVFTAFYVAVAALLFAGVRAWKEAAKLTTMSHEVRRRPVPP